MVDAEMNKMMCTLAEEVMDVVVNMEESSKRVKRRRVPKRVPQTESGSGVGEFMAGCYWIGHGKHQSLFNHIVETQVPSHGKPKGGLAADLGGSLRQLHRPTFGPSYCGCKGRICNPSIPFGIF